MITMREVTWSLIFIMGILIPGKTVFISNGAQVACCLHVKSHKKTVSLFTAICNLSILVLSAFSLVATVVVITIYHKPGTAPDWLQDSIQRLPSCLTKTPVWKSTIESLVLNSSLSTSCRRSGETGATPHLPQTRIKWSDVAKTLDRLLFFLFVGMNIILIGYFIGIWLMYYSRNRSN